jgi:hypothetical protein
MSVSASKMQSERKDKLAGRAEEERRVLAAEERARSRVHKDEVAGLFTKHQETMSGQIGRAKGEVVERARDMHASMCELCFAGCVVEWEAEPNSPQSLRVSTKSRGDGSGLNERTPSRPSQFRRITLHPFHSSSIIDCKRENRTTTCYALNGRTDIDIDINGDRPDWRQPHNNTNNT